MAEKAKNLANARGGKTCKSSPQAKLDYLDAFIAGRPKDSYKVKCADFTVADFCCEIRRLATDGKVGAHPITGMFGIGYLSTIAKRVEILAGLLNPQILHLHKKEEYDEHKLPNGEMQRLPKTRGLTTAEKRLCNLCWQAIDAARYFVPQTNSCKSRDEAIARLTVIADALAEQESTVGALQPKDQANAPKGNGALGRKNSILSRVKRWHTIVVAIVSVIGTYGTVCGWFAEPLKNLCTWFSRLW